MYAFPVKKLSVKIRTGFLFESLPFYFMLHQRFEYLLAKELSDQLTVEEAAELKDLLESSSELKAEYQLLHQYWNRKETSSERDKDLFNKVLSKIESPAAPKKLIPSFLWRLTAAAAVLVLVSLAFWFYQMAWNPDQEVSTANQQRTWVLEDGTSVTLNAASSLTYPKTFDSLTREVYLVGEAFFKVAKDEKRPFIVRTLHAHLKVLGTSFNLRAYPDENKTETSLIEGAIEVSLKGEAGKTVRLQPSEKLTIYNSVAKEVAPSKQIIERSSISFFHPKDTLSIETSWLDNKLVFKDTSFEELARTLERKYGVEIEFQGKRAPALRFNAVFEKEDIGQILRALKMASNFSYQQASDKIMIYD